RLNIIRIEIFMAAHTSLIFRRPRREFRPADVAGTALLVARHRRIEKVRLLSDRRLVVGVVAFETIRVFSGVLDFQGAMDTLIQVV
ncbi:MAG: hypothetical protein R6V46_17195, partial [Desulfatiglandaceae bacterium]